MKKPVTPDDMDDDTLNRALAQKRASVDRTGNFVHYASGLLALGGLCVMGMTGLPFVTAAMLVGGAVIGVTLAGALVARKRVQRLHEEGMPLAAEQYDRMTNPAKRLQKLGEKFERAMKTGAEKDIVVKKPLQIKKPQP
jgi:hypothetical protein